MFTIFHYVTITTMFNHSFSIIFFITCLTTVSAICSNTFEACAAGCYNAKGITFNGGLRYCEAVGAGWYSPNLSNDRFPCEQGQYSNNAEASSCQLCAPGTIAGGYVSTSCFACPTGYYQSQYGQHTCLSCNPHRFRGVGSNAVEYDASINEIYCSLVGVKEPSASPSESPTKIPTVSPSPLEKPGVISTVLSTLKPTESPLIQHMVVPGTLLRASSSMPSISPSTEHFEDALDPPIALSKKKAGVVMFGLISVVLLIAVAGTILVYFYKQPSQSPVEPDAILIQIGGEVNQNNCMLDSHLTSREERDYDDAMDDIEAAMDEDVYEKSESTQYTVAQVISVEDYVSPGKKEVKCKLDQKI